MKYYIEEIIDVNFYCDGKQVAHWDTFKHCNVNFKVKTTTKNYGIIHIDISEFKKWRNS